MADLTIASTNTADVGLDAEVVEAFRAKLRGKLLLPSDSEYDEARQVHNGMIDRHPALIVRSAGAADVISSVKFCREHELLLSVHGGGHSVPGFAVCDGGVMIDLSPMNSVRVDPAGQTARVGGGTTWGEVDHEAAAFGLATTGGVARPTGVGGFTLGGGHGFLMRKHGLACDNLVAADIVTAEGELLSIDEERNADLFWGIRGGGGNFGIVTSFEFRLYPVDHVYGGMLIFPLAQGKKVLRAFREIASEGPDELGMAVGIATHPEIGQIAGVLVCHAGSFESGEKLLRPLRAISPIAVDQVGPCPYTAVQSIGENFNPRGFRNYWKSNFLRELGDDLIDLLIDRYPAVPAPHSHFVLEAFGGAVSRVPGDATAFNNRGWPFNLLIAGMWDDRKDDERNIGWVREMWQAVQPFSSGGVYVNYMDRQQDEGEERLRSAYGPEKYERLVGLKNKYDPANLFRMNQNIKPTV